MSGVHAQLGLMIQGADRMWEAFRCRGCLSRSEAIRVCKTKQWTATPHKSEESNNYKDPHPPKHLRRHLSGHEQVAAEGAATALNPRP